MTYRVNGDNMTGPDHPTDWTPILDEYITILERVKGFLLAFTVTLGAVLVWGAAIIKWGEWLGRW